MGVHKQNKTKRFWSKVAIKGQDECWEWTSSKIPIGYGQFWRDGKVVYAHRIAFEMTCGYRIPSDLNVLHTCDNRACCNPDHLRLGTQQDNVTDMMNKGRWRLK